MFRIEDGVEATNVVLHPFNDPGHVRQRIRFSHIRLDVLPPNDRQVLNYIGAIHDHREAGNDGVAGGLPEHASNLLLEKLPCLVVHEGADEMKQVAVHQAGGRHHGHVVLDVVLQPGKRSDLDLQPLFNHSTSNELLDGVDAASAGSNVILRDLHFRHWVAAKNRNRSSYRPVKILIVNGAPATGHLHSSWFTIGSTQPLLNVDHQLENDLGLTLVESVLLGGPEQHLRQLILFKLPDIFI